eukprot:3646077-Alexandrium_andersonii.AAC.1
MGRRWGIVWGRGGLAGNCRKQLPAASCAFPAPLRPWRSTCGPGRIHSACVGVQRRSTFSV